MTARRPLVLGNWKMHLTEHFSVRLVQALLPKLPAADRVEVAVAPSFPCLRAVADALQGSAVALAAQNVHWEEKGAYTGEVSPQMLAELGTRYVIVGHSERRALFAETDERVGRKVRAVCRHAMIPVLCIGEQAHQRDEGRTLAVVERQLRVALDGVSVPRGEEIVVAYEPVWAIGTGRHATTAQVHEVHRMVREQLASLYGYRVAATVRLLYGGSVDAENAAELLAGPEVDGVLVGGASLDADAFAAIAAAAAKAAP